MWSLAARLSTLGARPYGAKHLPCLHCAHVHMEPSVTPVYTESPLMRKRESALPPWPPVVVAERTCLVYTGSRRSWRKEPPSPGGCRQRGRPGPVRPASACSPPSPDGFRGAAGGVPSPWDRPRGDRPAGGTVSSSAPPPRLTHPCGAAGTAPTRRGAGRWSALWVDAVRPGAERTDLFLDAQLVVEVPGGRGVSRPGRVPEDLAVGRVAVDADVVGRAVYFCEGDRGQGPEPQGLRPRSARRASRGSR